MTDQAFRPRLNHVAISVDPAVLDEEGRATVLDFYGEVFGWSEGDNTGESGNPLILYTGAPAQFVYLLPAEPFLVAPALDHFGLELASVGELEQLVDLARAYKLRDDRVRIIDTSTAGHPRTDPRLRPHQCLYRISPSAHGRTPAPPAFGACEVLKWWHHDHHAGRGHHPRVTPTS